MARPRRIVPLVLLSAFASPALASPHAQHPAPPSDDKAPKKLIALRAELHFTQLAEVRKQAKKFRPLCDADGYPLVGNVNDKGVATQPSEWCADVRASVKKT